MISFKQTAVVGDQTAEFSFSGLSSLDEAFEAIRRLDERGKPEPSTGVEATPGLCSFDDIKQWLQQLPPGSSLEFSAKPTSYKAAIRSGERTTIAYGRTVAEAYHNALEIREKLTPENSGGILKAEPK